jgi:oxalate decarboxylase
LSRHAYRVDDSEARVERDGGVRVDVTADQLPLLSGMALATLSLEAGAAREPHWHPNAAELSYCLEGSARMTIVEPGGGRVTLGVEPGDLVFVPPGLIHDIESTADSATRFVICFSHERYEDLNLSTSVSQMPAHVLAATFGGAGGFDWVEPAAEPAFVARPEQAAELPEQAASPYRYQLERMEPRVANDGGSLIFARGDDFPVLAGLAMYSLRMTGRAVREPHWHPNAAELNYVIEGAVRLTIVSPGGDVETVDIGAGEISYIPCAYFHHIENLGDEPARLAVFFDHELPGDNGIAAAMSAYPNGLLASVFGEPAATFEALPDLEADVLLSPPPSSA